MPLLSRLGGQPRVAEDTAVHYLEAAKRTLAMVADETSMEAPVSTVLAFMHNDSQKLALLLSDMLAKREQWLPLTSHHQAADVDTISHHCAQIILTVIEEQLSQASQALPSSCQAMLMPVVRFAASNLEETHPLRTLLDWQLPLTSQTDELPSWLTLIDFLLTDKGTLRKSGGLNVKAGFPKDHPDKASHIETFEQVTALIGDPAPFHNLRTLPILSEDELHRNSLIVRAFSQVITDCP